MALTELDILRNLSAGDSIPLSIAQLHPLYIKNKKTWDKCRDAYGGQEEIKAKTTKYPPVSIVTDGNCHLSGSPESSVRYQPLRS